MTATGKPESVSIVATDGSVKHKPQKQNIIMKKTVCTDEFVSMFDDCGRSENFSLAGRYALYEYIEELEQDTGTEIECDIIAFCVEYSEYESAKDCIESCQYDFDLSEYDEAEEAALEWLRENTQVIEFDEGIIIQDF